MQKYKYLDRYNKNMSWTLCTSGSAIAKAGVNVNSKFVPPITAATEMAEYSDQSEGSFCAKTRRDWVTTAGGTQIMNAVEDAVSADIAIKMIENDMSGFIKGEAQTMLDVLTAKYDTIIATLIEDKNQVLNK